MLGDEDRRPISYQFSENLGRFPLQGCNQLGFHKSDTKVSLCFLQAQTVRAANLSLPERLEQNARLLSVCGLAKRIRSARSKPVPSGDRRPSKSTICASRERQPRKGRIPSKNGGQGPPVQESSTTK